MPEYVIFTVSEQLMAVPIENVERIMIAKNIAKIPLDFDCIEGAFNYHERIISVINLRKLFKYEGDYKLIEGSQVIIVQTEKNKAAILIDEIKDIEVVEKNAPCLEVNSKYVSKVIQSGKNIINILNPKIIDLYNEG